MRELLKNLSESTKGYILITAGVILLLHTMRILEHSLYYLLILGSLMMIIYGFVVSGLYDKCLKLIKK